MEEKIGTPNYLAPELWIKPAQYSVKSDVWALGVILYNLCCLEMPFPATFIDELKFKVLADLVKQHPLGVRTEFVNLFTRMLEKNPAYRPSI